MINRLQFRYHDPVFDTRESAIEYIKSQIRFAEEGLAKDDPSYGYSLLAEPTVLRYKNEEDETNPHIILTIGSATNEGTQYSDNRFCIIDIDKTEKEIADLQEELEAAIKSLTLVTKNSDTLNLFADKTEDGTIVSGDVKVADYHIFDNIRKTNNLMVSPDGLFIYVKMEYNEAEETFTFTVSKNDGTLETLSVNLPNNYVVSGYYLKKDESIHLKLKSGDEVLINCENLIAEWGVEGDSSKTPVVLTREEVYYDGTDDHHHVEPWQDILKADVRIKDEEKVQQPDGTYKYVKDANSTNILNRTTDGRYLYVDGKASNIIYYQNGEKTTVKAALDKLGDIKLSSDYNNILIEKTDGFFASTKLEYKSKENKLVFKASGQDDTIIQLNSFKLFENIYYDPTTENLVITYIDGNDQVQIVTIPIGEMMRDWEWDVENEGHNVKLTKARHTAGNDKLSADVKLVPGRNNILVDDDHKLYVRGEADNIKYGNSNVQDALDALKNVDSALDEKINTEKERAETAENALNTKIDEEEARAKAEEEKLDKTIGSGFSTDAHETVTYKFNELTDKVNTEAEKLQNEIDRSTAKDTEHDGKIESIEAEIGDGFGPRNTVRDEINAEKAARESADDAINDKIAELSANTEGRLESVSNVDHSINVDNTDRVNPVIKVNLSEEVEHGKENIIKLNADGLYAGVDLSYEETANKLIFSTTNGSKEIQLESMSSIISIEYNPTKEAIVITYMTNGHEIKIVEIPVGDLINEWRIWDGHEGAVQLEKTRIASGTSEQDILKASVVISETHEDNIIINDNGALYVSGQGILDNKAEINSLKERMTTAEGDIDNIESNLAEEGRRIDAIDAKIDGEIARSTEVDTRLSSSALTNASNIQAEKERAMGAENSIQTALTAEETRATTAEESLNNKIVTETTRATNRESYLEHLIEDEISNRISGDETLETRISSEIGHSRETENSLQTQITNEITRATNKETSLQEAITAETLRAQDADSVLHQKINNETVARTEKDSELESLINQEISRAQTKESVISRDLQNEIDRSVAEDNNLNDKIDAETARAQEKETELNEKLNASKLNFKETTSVKFNDPYNENNNVKADVKIANAPGENIIIIDGEKQGLYASVKLKYNPGTNKIHLETTAGEQEEIQLNAGALLDRIEYDSVNRSLVITYTDSNGAQHTLNFPVNELFNDWVVANPSENSAVELTKTINGSGYSDTLSGRVLLTNLDDNLVQIVNNGLYVSGSGVTKAQEDAECANSKSDKLYELLYGVGMAMPGCGESTVYHPYTGSCIISAATSFNEADQLLNDQICRILSMWVSGVTPTNTSSWVEEGLNRKIQVDARLSHGNHNGMTDDEFTITTNDGPFIEPNKTEFTDTNVLRIVNITDGPDHTTYPPDNPYNGLYVSNVWNCGMYYDDVIDAEAIAEAQAAGYKTNYHVDDSPAAENYNYNNNVR